MFRRYVHYHNLRALSALVKLKSLYQIYSARYSWSPWYIQWFLVSHSHPDLWLILPLPIIDAVMCVNLVIFHRTWYKWNYWQCLKSDVNPLRLSPNYSSHLWKIYKHRCMNPKIILTRGLCHQTPSDHHILLLGAFPQILTQLLCTCLSFGTCDHLRSYYQLVKAIPYMKIILFSVTLSITGKIYLVLHGCEKLKLYHVYILPEDMWQRFVNFCLSTDAEVVI